MTTGPAPHSCVFPRHLQCSVPTHLLARLALFRSYTFHSLAPACILLICPACFIPIIQAFLNNFGWVDVVLKSKFRYPGYYVSPFATLVTNDKWQKTLKCQPEAFPDGNARRRASFAQAKRRAAGFTKLAAMPSSDSDKPWKHNSLWYDRAYMSSSVPPSVFRPLEYFWPERKERLCCAKTPVAGCLSTTPLYENHAHDEGPSKVLTSCCSKTCIGEQVSSSSRCRSSSCCCCSGGDVLRRCAVL